MSAKSPVKLPTTEMAAALAAIDAAPDIVTAQTALKLIAVAIGMPVLAWSPDVAFPDFNAHMDAFMRRDGWPEAVMTTWWDRNVMLHSPIYIHCRTRALPFVSGVAANLPARRPELKRIVEQMQRWGVVSLITVPVHLPRGQVAMVCFAGPQTKSGATAILAAAKVELLAAAHLFMKAYAAETGTSRASEEDLSPITPREWECLRLTAQGFREEEVGKLVGLAGTTIRYHLDNVVRKLGALNRTHAVARAAQLGLLGPIS